MSPGGYLPLPHIICAGWKIFAMHWSNILADSNWYSFWYSYFQNLVLKIQGQDKSMGKVTGQGDTQSTIMLLILLPFNFKSNSPSIPEIQLFQNLNFNIQNFNVNIMGEVKVQGHTVGPTSHSLTLIPFVPCQSALPLLRYNYFKIGLWNSKVKFMGEVKIQGHIVSPTSYWLTSLLFHVNLPLHSCDATI